MNKKRLLVVIVGPTAVGKTSIAIEIANHFNCEIISSDSRQFYREMEIGTAKPTLKERSQAPHHFVDSHTVADEYDAVSFADDAEILLHTLFEKRGVQIMVGGSGLYIKALCEGLDDMPKADNNIRIALKNKLENEGLPALLDELKGKDPEYYDQVDHSNGQRIIRALEVIRQSDAPYSSFRNNYQGKNHDFEILKIGLEMDRNTLYERINKRMDVMLEAGLLEEAKKLYPFRQNNALQTVGYKEIFDFIDGKYDWEEAVRLLKRNSRRYAKRQLTWFKKDEAIQWFQPNELPQIISLAQKYLT